MKMILFLSLALSAGCVTTRQSVDVRVEVPSDGKPVAVMAYRLTS